jgi:6-phosphogluconolactonase
MELHSYPDDNAVARAAAAMVAVAARSAVAARGRFVAAFSGGRTPWMMLRALAAEDVPWHGVHLLQVDERVAPEGHADRNLTHVRESLLHAVPLPAAQVYPMPVEKSDLAAAVREYEQTLRCVAGTPAVLDLVHLGLGPDGHTASLVPGDPVLAVSDADVALSGVYQGRQRITLTYPVLNRARHVVWLVTGGEKVQMLRRLQQADPTIPAGRVQQEHAVILADRAAAGEGPS